MNLSEKIYYCRKKAGMTQESVADALSVSRQAVSKWETGEAEPEISKLCALARFFGVTTDWLLSESDPETPIEQVEAPVQPAALKTDTIESKPTSEKGFVRFVRRFSWLIGVVIAIFGARLALFGILANRMLPEKMMIEGNTMFNTVNSMFNSISIISLIIGILLIIGGIILTVIFAKNAKKHRSNQ